MVSDMMHAGSRGGDMVGHGGMMQDQAAAPQQAGGSGGGGQHHWGDGGGGGGGQVPWGQQHAAAAAAAHQQQFDMRPIVTVAMLQCQMCSQRFSMSGKLSDHRTPVLAVNPSQSIEGPYCIACAGKRDGLRSFQIDEARVALCKLWHQQLSMGAAYAALHHHQQQRLASEAAAAHAAVATQQQSGPPNSAAAAAELSRRMSAKQDAPGIMTGVTNTTKSRRPSMLDENTALAMPSSGIPRKHPDDYAGIVAAHLANSEQYHHSKRQKLGSNHHNNYVKTTWTPEEDAILMEAVTTSSEQPFTRWSDLSHQLPGRVGKQIRDRWLNHLDPKIDRSPFTREEDLKLYTAYKKHGKRWVEISTKFFDSKRSENHVKNRWYSAAFKKFVKTELGEDPFDNKKNGSSNGSIGGSISSHNSSEPAFKKKTSAQEPPVANSASMDSDSYEEKKEE